MRKLALATAAVLAATAGCSADGSGFDSESRDPDAGGNVPDAGNPDNHVLVPEAGLGDSSGSGGTVPQSCAESENEKSYIGCEYWPTMSPNSGLFSDFGFAVVANNPTGNEAVVNVDRGGNPVHEVVIPPGGLEVIWLPWVQELKQTSNPTMQDPDEPESALVVDGAFHVISSVPIVLYQFSPLEFQIENPPMTCPQLFQTGGCYSFTNDASLLLPTTALRTEYFAMSYPSHHYDVGSGWANTPGFVAVTAVSDGTKVTVKSSAHVRGGAGVQPMAPGDTSTFPMDAGDILVLASGALPASPTGACVDIDGVNFCPSPQEYDLTGTKITSDKPVSVLGGHDCTFVPYDRYACDHLEESMFPVKTLGKDLVVTAPHAVAAIDSAPGTPDNMFVRVMSAAPDNAITFDPPVHEDVVLGEGEWIAIGPVNQDFRVSADDRIMVAQFMVGENFSGESAGAGDPSQSIAIPTEQYRSNYTFLAPITYTHNFVNVVAPTGAAIHINGGQIPPDAFTPVGSSGLGVARHKIPGGVHTMSGDQAFGIVVYGYGSYTSYMYPGGLNLETVEILK